MLTILKVLIGEDKFERDLESIKNELNIEKDMLEFILLCTASILGFVLAAILAWHAKVEYLLTIFAFSFAILYVFAYSCILFIVDKRLEKKAESCSDALVYINMHRNMNTAKLIEKIANSELAIGKEFKKIMEEMKRGKALESALEELEKRIPKEEIKVLSELLKMHAKVGLKEHNLFRRAAEALVAKRILVKERANILFITKATVVLSAALLTPATMGLVLGFSENLNLEQLKDIIGGIQVEESFLRTLVFAYITEASIIASLFLGILEKSWKKAIVYGAAILLVALVSFNTAIAFFD